MYMCKLNDRVINLAHMVMAERVSAPIAKVRVTVVPGITFEEEGPDADTFLGTLHKLAADPMPEPRTTIIHHRQVMDGSSTFEKGA